MCEAENITPPYTAFVFGCSTCPVFVSSLVRLPVTAAVVWPLVRTRGELLFAHPSLFRQLFARLFYKPRVSAPRSRVLLGAEARACARKLSDPSGTR